MPLQKLKDAISKPTSSKRKRTNQQVEEVKSRGERIANIMGAVIVLSSVQWEVASQSVQGLWHRVLLSSRGLICACPANADGKMICKHVFAIHKLLEREWWNRARMRVQIKRQRLRCPYKGCLSYDLVKYGKRKCKKKDPVQRYLCKACRRTASGIDGFRHRHFDAAVIVKALSMTAAKMSPDEVRRQLKLNKIVVHSTTISKWSDYYSGIMCNYSATLRVDAGYQWHVDELFFKVLGTPRYLFTVMDGASRFILSYMVSPVKHGSKPTNLFMCASARSVRSPRILVSDGLHEFCKAAKSVFYKATGPRFVHIREIHIQNRFNQNNIYERLNGEFGERLQCTRGIKSENSSIIRMLIVYHNFFREHTALHGKTPAEAIGIDIMPVPHSDLAPECDRWITFIQNAALNAA